MGDINKEIPFTETVQSTINRVAPRENLDTSVEEQWDHLDSGTSFFVICIIIFCLCFQYLVPKTSNIKFLAKIIAFIVVTIFPFSWIISATKYPNGNYKYYFLLCLSIGIIFQFVTLLLSILLDQIIIDRTKEYNAKLTPEQIEANVIFKENTTIDKNNRNVSILFTTSISIMIANIAIFFYDSVEKESEKIKHGVEIDPASKMGTNIHWWMSFLYEKAHEIDNWWHETMDTISIHPLVKMFLLFSIGFLSMFFLFVKVVTTTKISTDRVNVAHTDVVNNTSMPEDKGPLIQNGMKLLPDNARIDGVYRSVSVNYLPSFFGINESDKKIDLFGLLVFFTSLVISIGMIIIFSIINAFIPWISKNTILFASMVSIIFGLSFSMLYLYLPNNYWNKIILFVFLISIVLGILGAPVIYMCIDIILLFFQKSHIKYFGNYSWFFIMLYFLIVCFIPYMVIKDNASLVASDLNQKIFTASLIALTSGWFVGLSFHFDIISFLFVIVTVPVKFIVKTFGPITVLALGITEVVLSSNSLNMQGKVTDGFTNIMRYNTW